MLDEGDEAPDFELESDGGEIIRLSALKGKPVIVYFYPKDDTSGCTKQAVAFTEKFEDFARLGVHIIGVSPDSAACRDKFKAKHKLTIQLAADTQKTACEAYGVWKEKSMYGRKYMGVERSTFLIGADGKILHIWRKVRVPGHVDDVLDIFQSVNGM